jgi:peptidoglycan/xylan/chitin deacetylase (PgdA/CDA1 family)
MKEIKIVVTMDCEPSIATSHPTATGPHNWELGQRAVEGYADVLSSYGLPVTLFIHPEAAQAQPDMFKQLRENGACLGLHMHPWKYSLWRHAGQRFLAHYGELSEAEQRELLSESSALWHDALGYRPTLFRPGTFSANDSIFKVLAELGFTGGSCSVPGRMMPEMRAIWVGAEPDPHRANAKFRQIAGPLDFVNVPVSTDFSIQLEGRIGRRLHPDLRPDTDWVAQYGLTYETIARNLVDQLRARNPAVPVINFISHNHFDYRNPSDPACIRLKQSLDALYAACDAAGIKPIGATVDDVVSEVLVLPYEAQEFIYEGAIMDKK